VREVKERVPDLEAWVEKYQDGRLLVLSGPRRAKYEALKVLIMRNETKSRRSPEKRSPRRESTHREASPKRTKQSSINITVPEPLVARLIGKNGENIRNIMHKSSSNISFQKQEQSDIKTPDGGPARICTLKGTPTSIADGLKILLDQVVSLSKH
jgi:predicted PilT family ATPase